LDGQHASAFLTSEVGDISAVTAGNGLTGGGTSGAVTLDVSGVTHTMTSFANQNLLTSSTPTFSKLTLGSGDDTLVFDGGDNQINTHDGFGNFNIKSGVDGNNKIVSTTGGSHIRLDESGRIALQIDESTAVGGSFSTGLSLTLDSGIVDISGGNLDMSSGKITGLATPTADSDAATKAYVDAAAGGPGTWDCTVRSNSVTSNYHNEVSTSCLDNEKVISGGCYDDVGTASIAQDRPTNQGWHCKSYYSSATNRELTAYANCCK
jgi:hypothetical protein